VPNRDLMDNLKIVRAISPQTQTNSSAAIVGQIIDTQGFDSLAFYISTGGLTDADASFAVTMDEGNVANLSDANAVAATDLLSGTRGTAAYTAASFTFTNDDSLFRIGYIGTKRYVRLTVTPTGNDAGAAPISAIALLGHPDAVGVGITSPIYLGP
jgi:hypothetical protein